MSILWDKLLHDNFHIYLQPKFNLYNSKLYGGEALVRYIDPEKGIIPPSEFISSLEENKLIKEIDIHVFKMVCKTLRKWIDKGLTPIPLSVNHSIITLESDSLVQSLSDTINLYKIPPCLLEIEITENAVFNNVDKLISIILELKGIGFTISLDDFGSGYSSLNVLKDIPVDIIKLDRLFLQETSNNKRGKIVISSMIEMAKSLNIKVVAEGVESKEQVDFLTLVKCDMAQGYYFSKPIPVKEFEETFL